MNTPDSDMRFGGFMINGMKLAFPLASLREVLPCQELLEIPSPAQSVAGGIAYRQVILPVIDLCCLLEQPQKTRTPKCILVAVVDQYIFGLLADAVSGIFLAEPASIKEALTTDILSSVFYGTVVRQDDQSLVSILSLEKIARADHFPMIADPEPARQSQDTGLIYNENSVHAATSELFMVVKCGQLDLAINALDVHTIISGFMIERSPLAMGNCLGTIHHMGIAIPIVDLQAFCGFGKQVADKQKTAFIISLKNGKVAFLIDDIIDIVRIEATAFNDVPAFGMSFPELFSGVIPNESLPLEITQKLNRQSHCLIINTEIFLTLPEVLNLASSNTLTSAQFANLNSYSDAKQDLDPHGRAMLIYDAGMALATPIEQILMILPYSPDMHFNDRRNLFLGLIESRGETIPLINLCHMHGLSDFNLTSSSCILVTEVEQQLLGFLVRELSTIANAIWEPEISDLSIRPKDNHEAARKNQLALFNIEDKEKMLHVKDLSRIACELQSTGYQQNQDHQFL